MLVLNPSHILFSGSYTLFITSVFYEVLSHLLLLKFIRHQKLHIFAGFIVTSYLFYLSRGENSAIFYIHLLCLLY